MNIEIFYISGDITALLIACLIVMAFGFGLRGKKFALSLVCGSAVFLLIQFLPIPKNVERNISLLALNVSKSEVNQTQINRKISSICADNSIRGYEYFELINQLSNAIELAVKINGSYDYKAYKEYNQICD